MPLTQSFKATVKSHLEKDAKYRRELLREAVECMVSGDIETGKAVLRNYINGTIGFPKPGEAMHRSPKSLMCMFGPQGNPQAGNLFEIVAYLQQAEGLRFEVRAIKSAA